MNSYTIIASMIDGLMRGGLYAGMALGLSMVFGVMRFVNVAYGELLVLSAFFVFTISTALGISPFLAMLLVLPLLFVVGYTMQRTVINPLMNKGLEPSLLTAFGLSIILQNVMILTWTGDTRALNVGFSEVSISLFGIVMPVLSLLAMVVGIGLTLGAHFFFKHSTMGRAFRAASQDAATARVLGVNVERVYAMTAGMAALCAAIAGTFIGLILSFTPVAGFSWLLKGFVIVVLGGMGSIIGTLVGGLVLGVSEGLGGAIFGTGYRDMVGFVLFLIILMIRPHGLFGTAGSEK